MNSNGKNKVRCSASEITASQLSVSRGRTRAASRWRLSSIDGNGLSRDSSNAAPPFKIDDPSARNDHYPAWRWFIQQLQSRLPFPQANFGALQVAGGRPLSRLEILDSFAVGISIISMGDCEPSDGAQLKTFASTRPYSDIAKR
jgi:hypothetical protein